MHVGDLNGTEQKGGREAFRKKEEEEEQSSVPLMADLRARQLQENQLKLTAHLIRLVGAAILEVHPVTRPTYGWLQFTLFFLIIVTRSAIFDFQVFEGGKLYPDDYNERRCCRVKCMCCVVLPGDPAILRARHGCDICLLLVEPASETAAKG